MSHLCGNGMIEMLELLEDIPDLDFNLSDSEGNSPLHFAAQAGHVEVVSFLLNKVRTIQVDPVNNLGFTPLMKAALQGRIKCSKLLLFSGASPIRRDHGRGLTAAQWARYCSRNLCADSIEKFIRTAVPGGQELTAAEAGGMGGTGGAAGAADRKLPFRTGSGRASWLARKFKKAFSAGGSKKANGGDYFNPSKASKSKTKFNVPQLHVTKDESSSAAASAASSALSGEFGVADDMDDLEDEEDLFNASAERDASRAEKEPNLPAEIQANSSSARKVKKKRKKN